MTWLPIRLFDYWDIARQFYVEHNGQGFVFTANFDEVLDEYVDWFTVYKVPCQPDIFFADNTWWSKLYECRPMLVGFVRTNKVQFDPTRREQIQSEIFDRIQLLAP